MRVDYAHLDLESGSDGSINSRSERPLVSALPVEKASFDLSATDGKTGSKFFWAAKAAFDVLFCLLLLPLLSVFAAFLLALNPIFNPGPLVFTQIRMGRNCRAFVVYKFRTMCPERKMERGVHDPVETDQISRFGMFLRKTRIDELPQILNVLKGDMSLIGPRPDYFPHARMYVRMIPEYRHRHRIKPGISGLAQVRVGYASGLNSTREKVRADMEYLRNPSLKMEAMIVVETIKAILQQRGT